MSGAVTPAAQGWATEENDMTTKIGRYRGSTMTQFNNMVCPDQA